MDVRPTVLDLLGVARGEAPVRGEPLFEVREGSLRPKHLERPQIAELLIERRNVMRAIIDGDWKYVSVQKWLPLDKRDAADRTPPETPLDPEAAPVREALFHLGEDPGDGRHRCDDGHLAPSGGGNDALLRAHRKSDVGLRRVGGCDGSG